MKNYVCSFLSRRFGMYRLALTWTLIIPFCLSQHLRADIVFTDFSATTGLTLNGSAAQSGTALQLTDGGGGESGSAWFNTPQVVANGFETTFDFRITPSTNPGADGIAFVVQTAGTSALGEPGGEIGYGGIINSLAIEFDTYNNGGEDISGNEVSFVSCGPGNANEAIDNVGCLIGTKDNPIPNLQDGQVHTAAIVYTPGTLSLSIDGTQDLTTPLFLSNELTLKGDSAFVGFTGATGGLSELGDVLNWSFTSTPVPEPSSLLLLAGGIGGLVFGLTWRFRKKSAIH